MDRGYNRPRRWVGRIPVIAKKLTGHVDNASFPLGPGEHQHGLGVAYQRYRAGTNFNNVRKTTITRGQPSAEHYDMINNTPKDFIGQIKAGTQSIFDHQHQPIGSQCAQFFAPTHVNHPDLNNLLAAGWGYCTFGPGSIQRRSWGWSDRKSVDW